MRKWLGATTTAVTRSARRDIAADRLRTRVGAIGVGLTRPPRRRLALSSTQWREVLRAAVVGRAQARAIARHATLTRSQPRVIGSFGRRSCIDNRSGSRAAREEDKENSGTSQCVLPRHPTIVSPCLVGEVLPLPARQSSVRNGSLTTAETCGAVARHAVQLFAYELRQHDVHRAVVHCTLERMQSLSHYLIERRLLGSPSYVTVGTSALQQLCTATSSICRT